MNGKLAALGATLLVSGALLARTVEPTIALSRVELAMGPALRVAPVASGAHPTALLGHGVTASKETLVRLGEALAASGFECLIVDFPGHGESRAAFGGDFVALYEEGARFLTNTNRVDVVAGHSMGAYLAAHALETHRIEAKLLLAFGAVPHATTETLYLEGAWDELLAPPRGAVVSPWSDHCLEPWDSVLVEAAVKAACAKTGLTPVPVSRFRLRLLGALLVLAGAITLLSTLTPRRTHPLVGLGVAAIALTVPTLGAPLWVGGGPTRTHLLLQIPAALAFGLGSLLVARFAKRPVRVTQGALAALGLLLAASQVLAGNAFGALIGTLFTGLLALGWALGSFAEARAGTAAGHVAFAVWLGYVIGQWCPLIF